MKTFTIPQAADILHVGHETICTYLGSGKLAGSRKADEVSAASVTAYCQSIIPYYNDLAQLLKDDDGLTDSQRGFDPCELPVRLPYNGLTDRERTILRMRVKFMQYKEIGAALAPPVTGQRVGAIIRTVLKRLIKG